MGRLLDEYDRKYRMSPEMELNVVKAVLALDIAAVTLIMVWYWV